MAGRVSWHGVTVAFAVRVLARSVLLGGMARPPPQVGAFLRRGRTAHVCRHVLAGVRAGRSGGE
eukprot:9208545-Alexandrium_andersonii.AAC.1